MTWKKKRTKKRQKQRKKQENENEESREVKLWVSVTKVNEKGKKGRET